ncbi:MAG: CDP-alcohol phosphatidyltransferase family protein [Merdibacter sp.]
MKFRQLFAIPNLLCYLRIALIPYFVVTYLHAQEAIDYLYTALILAVMEITDFLDGFIARRYHMVTEIGKIIDPIADKLLQLTLLVLLIYQYPLAVGVLVLFLIKETSMTICGLVSIRKNAGWMALWCGKVATTVFYICMVLLILFPISQPLADILLLVTAAFLIYSFIVYMKTYYQM